jgi:hypothetical protein
MGVVEVVGREGVGGEVSWLIRVWKSVEKSLKCLFENECEAAARLIERNRLDSGRFDVSHAASGLFVPSDFDGFVASIIEALDKGASEVSRSDAGRARAFFRRSAATWVMTSILIQKGTEGSSR